MKKAIVYIKNAGHIFRPPRLKFTIAILTILILSVYILNQEEEVTALPDPFDSYGRFKSQTSNRYFTFADSDGKISWEDPSLLKRESLREGPGEKGQPVNVVEDEKKAHEESIYWNGYSGYVSNKISLARSVPDYRHPECKEKKYIKNLPDVSIIIPFYEEHAATLKRTIISILNRAPSRFIKEIILVDDGSKVQQDLQKPFDDWIKDTFPANLIKLIRSPKRQGLIRARTIGALEATTKYLIFLDCHVEAAQNWLPPLIEPIVLNNTVVTCPIIDVIDMNTFEVRSTSGARGVFDWDMNYKLIRLRDFEKKRPAEPYENPVMAGGLFAIHADWFWKLGGYDPGLMIWGGEQYEISFKIWMCGGRLIDIPCSRISHIYRHTMPYENPFPNFYPINIKRIAVTLMEGYEKYVYKRLPSVEKANPGEVESRRAILRDLKCKSFDWFMMNVARDMLPVYPGEIPKMAYSGKLRTHNDPDICVTKKEDISKILLVKCEEAVKDIGFTHKREIRFGNNCFDFAINGPQEAAIFFKCHSTGGNQKFRVTKAADNYYRMSSTDLRLCVTANTKLMHATITTCDENNKDQLWKWDVVQKEAAVEEWKKLAQLAGVDFEEVD